jgi:hypothetical protein
MRAVGDIASAEFVVAHAARQSQRGKGPSESYRGEKNPRKALKAAERDLTGPEGRYNVVFEYTAATGGYEGVRTWTGWPNKAKFQKDWAKAPSERKAREIVVAEGVTQERAVELVDQVSIDAYIRAAVQEATNRKTGRFDKFLWKMEIEKVAVARREEVERMGVGMFGIKAMAVALRFMNERSRRSAEILVQ